MSPIPGKTLPITISDRSVIAGWSWEYGLVDFMQGPIAKATNNTDISWLTAFVVSGGLYWLLRPILAPSEAPEAAPTH